MSLSGIPLAGSQKTLTIEVSPAGFISSGWSLGFVVLSRDTGLLASGAFALASISMLILVASDLSDAHWSSVAHGTPVLGPRALSHDVSASLSPSTVIIFCCLAAPPWPQSPVLPAQFPDSKQPISWLLAAQQLGLDSSDAPRREDSCLAPPFPSLALKFRVGTQQEAKEGRLSHRLNSASGEPKSPTRIEV